MQHDSSLSSWHASYDPGAAKTILNNGRTCRVVFDDTFDRSGRFGFFGGVVRNRGLQSARYQKASFSIQLVQASREKSLGNVKKVVLEFILVDVKWNRKAVSCRGTPEIQTQLDGGLLLLSPPSTQTPHLQVFCKGQEWCPEGFRML